MMKYLIWPMLYIAVAVMDFDLAFSATDHFNRICWLIGGVVFTALAVRD